ncbi:thioesterase superfamily protein [Purpureocillium lavendulum]|uniref:Thioesterase superfamily protein n=1 Tax=Purpureocillium lavendulum TaxID=1247861 RepID=A0AB34G0J8_9HYPO|nr:thioesterase superfamily protein [Purpureocillium lavendulum]
MSEKPSSSSVALSPLNRVLSPPLNLIPPGTPPRLFESAVSYFTSLPWCAALINDPSPSPETSLLPGHGPAIGFIPQCFNPVSARHDQFVGRTLSHGHPYYASSSSGSEQQEGVEGARGSPVRHWLSLFRPADASQLRDPSRPILRVATLIALGDGTSGYEGIVHGGLTATLLDESLGVINELNTALGKEGSLFSASSVTASLSIKFLAPVATAEKAVCVTAWVESMQGRKTMMKAEVTNGKGEKLAVAESVWVAVKPKL